MDICEVEGCEAEVRARSFCARHYSRWWRTGHPLGTEAVPPRPKPRATTEKRCAICNEVKAAEHFYKTSKGHLGSYCKPCKRQYYRARRTAERMKNPRKPRPKVEHGPCAFDGCDREAKAKGKMRQEDSEKVWLCTSHWNQYNRGLDCTPLLKKGKSYINDDVRICTGCMNILPASSFYLHSSGKHRQGRCRECHASTSRFNFLKRQERWEEAAALLERMPKSLQDKYKEMLPNE